MIEKINGSLEGLSNRQNLLNGTGTVGRAYMSMPCDSTSFTGGSAPAATKSLKEFLLELMPSKISKMVKIHGSMGEVQNQIINAVGTGLVAPLFIKYNPLSDTDESTRTYTAWRQPVSAVLAVGTQAAIVIPFNKLIKNLGDIGYLPANYNSSLFPSEDRIKAIIKEKNPDKTFTAEEMKAEVKKYSKECDKKLIEMISNDKIIFDSHDGKTAGKTAMSNDDFKKLFTETIDDVIKLEERELMVAAKEKLPRKVARDFFYHAHPEEAREVLNKLRDNISRGYNQISPNASDDQCKRITREFSEECDNIIKDLKQRTKKDASKKDVNEELIKIVNEIKAKNIGADTEVPRIINNKVNNMLARVDLMSNKSLVEITNHVNSEINKRMGAIDGTLSTLNKIKAKLTTTGITVKEAQAIVDDAIKTSANALRAKFRSDSISETELKNTQEWAESVAGRLETKINNVAEAIAEKQKKHVKSNIEGLKRWTGLGVSLAILPLTCYLLNKIYPWFMDKVFPDLSKGSAKSDKNAAAEKVEVK